ncbi:MAG: hypothetical protein COW00_09240 [Bdellovibrio sp. CG12_big_fil_rev_8_21_14_0_65_39_13]|nr:MAG: hypothetical protein COW78_09310 [Bdellovibrio sp. CG22_combo_CG10-13_8_21_14_all_39_27]PIQ59806.1 MAG: hypothetical protein COW00_09240 [Bdellovibrio sp. CG12_big_fil_rev_8_21_14_0_65_39_13]PIR36166.1 MAG: hypothetical protein COV37_04150 [Bdellovibrio sp. CG11_big_fil_rev_8_21_14_0_20_39_38]PJB52776.1 MAG: hypothetical protein CO099_10800 [Bdellovibrio sp. CG_4_9_14_3_um_filter_39_7]
MQVINSFFELVSSMGPALLLGLLLSGILHEFLDQKKVERWIKGPGFWPVLKSALIGIPLPLCSCSVLPTAVELKKKGASNASTSAFLISTPETGVDSIFVTYTLLDLPMTLIRPIAALIISLIAGIGQLIWNSQEYSEVIEVKKSCCGHDHEESEDSPFLTKLIKGIKYSYHDIVDDLALWLFVGIFLSSLATVLIPQDWNEILQSAYSRYLILLIGIPVYICASASTPIAATLMMKGLSPGSALVLLITGPATNLANLAVMQKTIGKKGIVINLVVIAVVALGLSYIVDFLYQTLNLPILFKISSEHTHQSHFEKLSGLVLLLLMGKGIYQSHLKKLFNPKKKGHCCT